MYLQVSHGTVDRGSAGQSTGDSVSEARKEPSAVAPGTLLHKAIPPRMVEPYLSGRRSIISGFVYRADETDGSSPRELYRVLGLGYPGTDFSPDMAEIYLLRWRAVGIEAYRVPYSAKQGGDWSMAPPFTGTGFTLAGERQVAEYFTDPMPVPVGAEIHRIGIDRADFVARYDGQAWLPTTGGT